MNHESQMLMVLSVYLDHRVVWVEIDDDDEHMGFVDQNNMIAA
jgi:hypothetical protein